MRIGRKIIAVLCAGLCVTFSGCGGEGLEENLGTKREETMPELEISELEETLSGVEISELEETLPEQEETISEPEETIPESDVSGSGTETEQTALSELSGAYLQMALYIQEGFRIYHVEGEYQAYFGPIEGDASLIWVDGHFVDSKDQGDDNYFQCDILLEGEGEQWKEELAFSYDAETDWYAFSAQYEPLFAGDTLWAGYGDSYVAEFLEDCVCQTTIARNMDIAAPIRYDSEGGPMEKDLRLDRPWFFREDENGLAYQISPRVYYYWDERLDVYIEIEYPQLKLEEGQKEIEESLNEKLRDAFFYGYEWEEEDNSLSPSKEMYTDIERTYLITREDERYLSMRIYEYNSFRGANHPNEWETGITLDMRTGETVRLEDVLGEAEVEEHTLKELLDRGDFRCLWTWQPGGEGWIEELKQDDFYKDRPLSDFETKFYLTDTGFGLITSMYRYYTCLETDYEKLGIEGF